MSDDLPRPHWFNEEIAIIKKGLKDMACDRPPAGWHCTREYGHDGPCPTVENEPRGLDIFPAGLRPRVTARPLIAGNIIAEIRRALKPQRPLILFRGEIDPGTAYAFSDVDGRRMIVVHPTHREAITAAVDSGELEWELDS